LLKKLTAIFLLLQFLTNNSFAEEIMKLPKLFTHYYHHSHEHRDSSDFTDYLVQHYSNDHEKEEHRGEDSDCNLPFKHCDNCCVSAHAPVLAFMPSVEESGLVFAIAITKTYTFENDKIQSMCSPPVWQPPKFS
jgi:hypothetical protein